MLGSPACGADSAPPTAGWTYSRLSVPPTQRRPSPKATGAIDALPWRKMLLAVGSSPDAESSSVSFASEALPAATRSAPPVPAELSQPRGLTPLLPQGQAASRPSPGQKRDHWAVQ